MSTQNSKSSITKQVVFSEDLVGKAEERAQSLGITFPEYVRFLIVQDTKQVTEQEWILNSPTAQEIIKSVAAHKAGDFRTLGSDKDIDSYIDEMSENA